jgi:hypothetical protein
MSAHQTPNELSCIRVGTNNDIEDAIALASRVLSDGTGLDYSTHNFSKELFAGVALYVA